MKNSLLRTLIKQMVLEASSSEEEGEVGRPREDPQGALSRWIERQEDTEKAADKLGISPPHLNKLARGDAKPSLQTALKIADETIGEVDVESWMNS